MLASNTRTNNIHSLTLGSSLTSDRVVGGGGGLLGGEGSWKETLLAVASVGVEGLRRDCATANEEPRSGGWGALVPPADWPEIKKIKINK